MRKYWIVIAMLGIATSAQAAKTYNASHSNTTAACPSGQHADRHGNCVKDEASSINYNSSKSNTGNLTKSINYNASKSNTGNRSQTGSNASGPKNMAIKGTGVPANGTMQTQKSGTPASNPH